MRTSNSKKDHNFNIRSGNMLRRKKPELAIRWNAENIKTFEWAYAWAINIVINNPRPWSKLLKNVSKAEWRYKMREKKMMEQNTNDAAVVVPHKMSQSAVEMWCIHIWCTASGHIIRAFSLKLQYLIAVAQKKSLYSTKPKNQEDLWPSNTKGRTNDNAFLTHTQTHTLKVREKDIGHLYRWCFFSR